MYAKSLNAFQGYLRSQTAVPVVEPKPPPLAITISREAGAGGTTVAALLTERLTASERAPTGRPWVVFDANLAKEVLQDHQLPAALERFVTEDARLPIEAVVEEVLGSRPSAWTLVQHTTQTMLRLAGLGNAVLVGRGGNVITARLPHVFHVRLVAPLEMRIRHASEIYGLPAADAAKLVQERDLARRRYVRRHFNVEIGDPTLYDVTVNTSRLGFAGSADAIARMALQRRAAPTMTPAERQRSPEGTATS